MGKIDVWTMHKSKRILVTDAGGVPVEALGYVSQEAAQAAQARGSATISELGFNSDDYATFDDWGNAEQYAHEKAASLNYTVEVESIFEPWADYGDDDDYFDETDDDFEEMYDPNADAEYDEDWDEDYDDNPNDNDDSAYLTDEDYFEDEE